MTVFFAVVVVVGALWLLLENGAKHASVAPSMYRTSGNGWLLIIVGAIGILCVRFLS